MIFNIPEKLLYNESEAAAFLNISKRKFWDLVNEGKIRKLKIGRSVRYDVRDLVAYTDSLKPGPKAG